MTKDYYNLSVKMSEEDYRMLCAIADYIGEKLSTAVRVALKEYCREHDIEVKE